MSDKVKFPRADAIAVAKELCDLIRPHCATIQSRLGHRALEEPQPMLKVCGSLRRKKAEVGDVEIVFITAVRERVYGEPGLFETFKKTRREPMVHALLDALVGHGALTKRPNKNGGTAWGESNRLAVHTASGIPVDFFATTFEHWWMTVVIRTGPADFNVRLIESARRQGYQLHAYPGKEGNAPFTRLCDGARIAVESEREVFEKAGLSWLEPEDRR